MDVITAVVADDHALIRAAIIRLLSDIPKVKVIGEAQNGEEAIKIVKDKNPDVLLMDVMMPGIGGIKAAERILPNKHNVKIIMLSAYMSGSMISSLLKIGAHGCLTKGADPEEMMKAIYAVVKGKTYLEPKLAHELAVNQFSDPESLISSLSARELDVMLKIISGESVEKISEALCLSPKTVNCYRYRIQEKLGVRSDVELVLFASKVGLLDVLML